MYRLITCDLDETLLSSDKTVSKRNRKAIATAKEKGVHFVPSTGRGYTTFLYKTLEELGLKDLENEYTVSFNGGVITENRGNKIIDETPMDFELIKKLFELGLDYDVCMHVYSHEVVYIYNLNQEEKAYLPDTVAYQEFFEPSIDFLKETPLIKILFQNLDRRYLAKIHEAVPKELLEVTDTSYSSNRYFEFNPLGVNKGAALLKLADKLGIPKEETMAIGDNVNDLSMILAAELGIAVANAVPEIQEQADYITHANHNEGGVGEAIETFILKED